MAMTAKEALKLRNGLYTRLIGLKLTPEEAQEFLKTLGPWENTKRKLSAEEEAAFHETYKRLQVQIDLMDQPPVPVAMVVTIQQLHTEIWEQIQTEPELTTTQIQNLETWWRELLQSDWENSDLEELHDKLQLVQSDLPDVIEAFRQDNPSLLRDEPMTKPESSPEGRPPESLRGGKGDQPAPFPDQTWSQQGLRELNNASLSPETKAIVKDKMIAHEFPSHEVFQAYLRVLLTASQAPFYRPRFDALGESLLQLNLREYSTPEAVEGAYKARYEDLNQSDIYALITLASRELPLKHALLDEVNKNRLQELRQLDAYGREELRNRIRQAASQCRQEAMDRAVQEKADQLEQTYQVKINTLQQENAKLKAEVMAHKQAQATPSANETVLQQELTALRGQVNDLRRDNSRLKGEQTTLCDELEQLRQQNQTLRDAATAASNGSKDQEIKDLKQERTDLLKQRDRLQDKLRSQDADIKRLTAERDKAAEQFTTLQQEYEDMKTKAQSEARQRSGPETQSGQQATPPPTSAPAASGRIYRTMGRGPRWRYIIPVLGLIVLALIFGPDFVQFVSQKWQRAVANIEAPNQPKSSTSAPRVKVYPRRPRYDPTKDPLYIPPAK